MVAGDDSFGDSSKEFKSNTRDLKGTKGYEGHGMANPSSDPDFNRLQLSHKQPPKWQLIPHFKPNTKVDPHPHLQPHPPLNPKIHKCCGFNGEGIPPLDAK